ncbi:apolipoprotein D-like [Rhinoraja longicauda]
MQGLLLLLAISTFCFTRASSSNLCPNVEIQQNFTLRKYLGIWHEIERLPTHFVSGQCVSEKYTLDDGGWIKLNTVERLENGSLQHYEGDLVPTTLNVTATLQYKSGLPFQSIPDLSEFSFVPYIVLSTNYTSYSLVYSCVPKIPFHWGFAEYAWILARERHLPEKVILDLHKILEKNNIPFEEMIKTHQENCPQYT